MTGIACGERRLARCGDARDLDIADLDRPASLTLASGNERSRICGGLIERKNPSVEILAKRQGERLFEGLAPAPSGRISSP